MTHRYLESLVGKITTAYYDQDELFRIVGYKYKRETLHLVPDNVDNGRTMTYAPVLYVLLMKIDNETYESLRDGAGNLILVEEKYNLVQRASSYNDMAATPILEGGGR